MVEFGISEKYGWYWSYLSHFNNSKKYNIFACFDTGCVYTTIGIYSLSKLINIPVEVLRNEMLKRSSDSGFITGLVANGETSKNIVVEVKNISIGDIIFKSLFCTVILDDSLCNSNGVVSANNSSIDVEPYMLLGLDFIRSVKDIDLKYDRIICSGFDFDKYNQFWYLLKPAISLWSNMTIDAKFASELKLNDSLPEIDS